MQAARGASLTRDQSSSHPLPAQRRRYLLWFAGVALVGYAADLLSKILAVSRLEPGHPVPLVGSLLQLDLARNPGAAFSTGTSYTLLLSLVAVVAAVAVLWNARRLGSLGWAIGLGFLLAGVLGNLTDRVFRQPGLLRGHVVDFLELPHWPIFNLADVCINVAAVFIVIQAMRGVRVDGGRQHGRSAAEPRRAGADPDEPEASAR